MGISKFDNISQCLPNLTLNKHTHLKCWLLNLKEWFHFVQSIKRFKDKWLIEAIYFAFIKVNFLKSKSESSVTYQIGLLPTKGALTYSGFIVGRRSRMLPYVLTHSNITWPALELCYFSNENYPLGERARVAEETRPEVANGQNLPVLIFSNWNKITFPC